MIATIDLHELTRKEAEAVLNIRLNAMDKQVREVVVIHGYHNGIKLRGFVRNVYVHPRILTKLVSANPGETIFQLKRK
jgi:DNA-nicking Smr family endonuclease